MADLRISQLPVLGGAALQADDVVATVDISASETKKITVKDLVQKTVSLIDPGSIPGDKFSITLTAGSVDTVALADGAVTAIKLADNSSAIVASPLPATGQFVGQLGVEGQRSLYLERQHLAGVIRGHHQPDWRQDWARYDHRDCCR